MNENKPEKPGEPEKDYTIIVNTREKTVSQEKITFAEIIALAYDNPPSGPDVYFTVAYRRGKGEKPEGTMVATDPALKLHDGMIFNVTATDKS